MIAPASVPPDREHVSLSGVGIGLRDPHFDELMAEDHGLPWVELLADNFLARGGLAPHQLDRIAGRFPVTLHCVGMNLGGTDPLDFDYLGRVRDISKRTRAAWVSDHVCFTTYAGRHYHDLLPLPYHDETLRHVANRIRSVQDFLGQQLVVENVSAYVRADTALTEAEFLKALCEEADCELLCDVNNLYVNQVNLGWDAREALHTLPLERIREIHLGGFEDKGHYLVDAHNSRVSEPVWGLFTELIAALPEVPVCIEWDNQIPDLTVLLDEAHRARATIAANNGEAA